MWLWLFATPASARPLCPGSQITTSPMSFVAWRCGPARTSRIPSHRVSCSRSFGASAFRTRGLARFEPVRRRTPAPSESAEPRYAGDGCVSPTDGRPKRMRRLRAAVRPKGFGMLERHAHSGSGFGLARRLRGHWNTHVAKRAASLLVGRRRRARGHEARGMSSALRLAGRTCTSPVVLQARRSANESVA